MRRWFSLFLTLALLLSLLPGAALAAGEQAPAEDTPAVEVQTEVPAEQPPELPPEPVVPEEDVDLLASGSATVSGTISLPNGASVLGDSYLYVNLYTPPLLDQDGQVLMESASVKGSRIFLSKGQSSCSYSFTGVEPGEYLLGVNPYLNSPSVLGGTCFFNADGTVAANDCDAVPLQVPASGCTANVTLPAAPRSISGTMTFDEPAAQETRIRIFSYDNNGRVGSHSASLTIPQGATSVEFSVGVGEGAYHLQFTNEDVGDYAFYGIHGDVTKDFQQQMVLSTLDGSVSGLRIDGSSLMSPSESNLVKVTVNLPAALTEERGYEISLYNAEQGYREDNTIIYLKPGDRSLEATLSIAEGQPFLVGYADATDCSVIYSETTGVRYATADGITGLASEAKVFTGGADTEITITEPPCYTVTGTLSRDDALLLAQAAFVLAEFDDGAVYAARVLFPKDQTSAPYTIYVPQSYQGQSFTLRSGKAMNGAGSMVSTPSLSTGKSYTLSGNVTADVTLPEAIPTIQGTISLPEGFTAPEGGLLFEVGVTEDYMYNTYATYYLPEGKSSFSYALCAPVQGETQVFADLLSPEFSIYERTSKTFPKSGLDQANLTFRESVTIRGTVTVPEACREGIALVSVNSSVLLEAGDYTSSGVNSSTKVAVLAGETQASYTLHVPKGGILTSLRVAALADTQNLLSTVSLYLQSDLKSFGTDSAALNAVLSEDMTLTTALTQGVFLSGTLSLAEGLSAGKYTGRIKLEPVSAGSPTDEYFNFTGDSYDYKLSLTEDAVGQQYYLSIYIYEGEGVLPYKDYYYVSGGAPTTDKSKATPITIGESGAVVDLTIPKARTISGSLVADDGQAVTWDTEENLRIYLQSDASNENFQVTMDAQGNWSAAVDDELTGNFKLRMYISNSGHTNIISGNYYYKEDGPSTTNEDEATLVKIGTGDVSGLKLYVATGWILSGTISLPEGGYITDGTVNVPISIKGPNSKYSHGNGTVGPDGGSWSVVVPKVEGTYQVTLNEVPSPQVSSNIYWGEKQTLEDITVTGDTDGLDFTLVKAKTVITGTVYRPEGVTEYLNLNINAQTKDPYGYYYTSASLSNDKNSVDFSIAIPESETATEYQLYYTIYSGTGVVTQKSIYLCADGSLTTDSSLAGTFSLADPPVHEFTPLTALPFASGKIYCPEELTENMTIVVDYQVQSDLSTQDMSPTAVEVLIGPGMGQQDEDGRWYSTYSLSGLEEGTSYKLTYYVYNESTLLDTNSHYVNSDGSVVGLKNAEVYTVPYNEGINTVSFTPILWNDGSEKYVLQSSHGFTSTEKTTYSYTYPGATSLEVTFSDRTDTTLLVNGHSYIDSDLAGTTLEIEGDTLTVLMPSLDGYTRRFGFAVEKVTPVGIDDPYNIKTSAAAVYAPSGSSEEAIMDSVKTGEPVRISLVSRDDPYSRYNVMGAVYNADGMLLDIVLVPVTFEGGTCTASLDFEQYGQAVTLKIFLTSETRLMPEMVNLTFNQQ